MYCVVQYVTQYLHESHKRLKNHRIASRNEIFKDASTCLQTKLKLAHAIKKIKFYKCLFLL